MPALQEILQVNGWSVQREDWADEAGRVEYRLFPPAMPIDSASTSIKLFIQRNIVKGELDLRFPTQLTTADFLSHVNKFVIETRGVQAPSRHELLLGRLTKGELSMETIADSLQKTRASRTKMYGFENGVYVYNNTDDWMNILESDEGLDIKLVDLPEAGSELDPQTFAVSLREKLPDQSLYNSHITVATESTVIMFFPRDFAIESPPQIFIYAPAEYLNMALSLLHNTAGMSAHTIPLDYIDRVVRSEVGQK